MLCCWPRFLCRQRYTHIQWVSTPDPPSPSVTQHPQPSLKISVRSPFRYPEVGEFSPIAAILLELSSPSITRRHYTISQQESCSSLAPTLSPAFRNFRSTIINARLARVPYAFPLNEFQYNYRVQDGGHPFDSRCSYKTHQFTDPIYLKKKKNLIGDRFFLARKLGPSTARRCDRIRTSA